MKEHIYAARKENLSRLVHERYDGNRAALARAAGIHQNQINLMLSSNEAHRRNMGEDLARRIEVAIGLPTGYFDEAQRPGALGDIARIRAQQIPQELSGPIRMHTEIHEIAVYSTWALDLPHRVTSPNNLLVCVCVAEDAAPAVIPGDTLIIDTGAKHLTAEGVWLIRHGDGALMRRVRAKIGGGWAAEEPVVGLVEIPKGVRVSGRVVAAYRHVAI